VAGEPAASDASCNGVDDDCDGEVDEGIDTSTDVENCGECGNLCSPAGAFPSCTDGTCGIDSCAPGRIDLDGLPFLATTELTMQTWAPDECPLCQEGVPLKVT